MIYQDSSDKEVSNLEGGLIPYLKLESNKYQLYIYLNMLTFRQMSSKNYEIFWGERRLGALKDHTRSQGGGDRSGR